MAVNGGFFKRKGKGRIDAYGIWEKRKEKWLTNFINRKDEPDFSVNQVITADMEWVAEAYMETDYSKLKEDMFINELKKYVSFEVLNL